MYFPFVARTGSRARPVDVVFEFSQTLKPVQDPRDLAVAFHSIQYINAAADVLGTLTFGTAEANALQGSGWYGNETDPNVGPFQWAGSAEKRASVRLPLPPGVEGLLLHITSIVDGLSMQVWVDGALQIAPRVEARWHQAYVPVGPPPAAEAPASAPKWIDGRYFPHLSAGTRLYAIHIRSGLEDWWNEASGAAWRINSCYDSMLALTLAGMQGVINRNGAWVYLDWGESGDTHRPSQHWLSLLRDSVPVVDLDLDGLSAVQFLYRRFATRFQGAVIYDPCVPDTINLATMYAGLEDRIMLAPEQLGLAGMPDLANVQDLRGLVQQQHWDASEDGKYRLYDWVYRTLWPRLEQRIVGVISPGPPTSREIAGASGYYYPLGLAARDYLVALRLSALWLSPVDEPQKSLLARFVQDAPAPAPVSGFFGNDEVGTVELVSRMGGWCPVLSNGNSPLAAGNVSVLSGVRPSLQRYPASIDPERVPATLERGPVFTMWSSDGDSSIFQLERGSRGGVDFTWEGVQGHRFGWTTNPTLVDLAPLAWNDYVATRREVSLVSGFSGGGYAYPTLMSEAQLGLYLTRTAQYLTDTGLRVLHVDNRFGTGNTMGNDIANQYCGALRDAGYLGAFTGASGWPWGLGFYYPDTPTPEVAPSYVLRPGNRAAIVADLLARRPGEYYVDLTGDYAWQENGTGYPWHRGTQVQDTAAHQGKSLRFAPDDAFQPGLVVWGPFSALAPGNYDVTFRLKVADNRDTRPIAQVYVGIQGADWQWVARRYVAPSDLSQAGQFQDISVSFGLARFAQNVEFRIDYYGGMDGDWANTDLHADTIVAKRWGGLDMPVFAAAFIPLVGPTQCMNDALLIAQDIERAGGLVLTPDEFMAALNPEYMASLAAQSTDAAPASVEAQRQLSQGDYLSALLSARAALRAAGTDRRVRRDEP